MIVDFHVHSTASDGTFSPSELTLKAKGFTALALTDHDNTDGVEELLTERESACEFRVPGVELSIDPGKGFDKFHLLCLGVDKENAALKGLLKEILQGRNARNERILANFAKRGIEIDADDIASYAHGDVLARPHFGRWLMNHGYVKSIQEAFDKYLAEYSPKETRCYEERFHPEQEKVFKTVHEAGGICVMAHPKYWRKYWRDTGVEFKDAEREIASLKEKGLDGLEAIYQANTGEESVEFTRIAMKLDLLKTAGSDFHGANKPMITLGMEVSDSFITPTLERLGAVSRSRGKVKS